MINYENNYRESALMDFENFLILKSQEIGLEILNDQKTKEFFEQIENFKQKLHTEPENSSNINEEKTKLIVRFYEYEGHYSTTSSIKNIIGFVIKLFFTF